MTPKQLRDAASALVRWPGSTKEIYKVHLIEVYRAHADALDERGELIEALKLIVELDKDAHPGLSTWHDARVKADQDARALLARIGE